MTIRAAFMLALAFALAFPSRMILAAGPDDSIRPFADGESVVFLGDSITHNGLYHSYIALFETTRHPDRTVRWVNSGVSGGKTKDALMRLQWDVLDHAPDHVFVMLGMNDAGTSHFLDKAPDQIVAENAKLLARYDKEMTEIVSKIRAARPRCEIVLCSASLYDQVGPQERKPSVGKNDAIRSQMPVLRRIAERFDCRFVDVNTPMQEIDTREKKADPAYSIVGDDRTHPGPVGHMVMANAILGRIPDTGVVSRIAVDYADPGVAHLVNASISANERGRDRTMRLVVKEAALPWPIDTKPGSKTPAAIKAIDLRPDIADLARESLRVANVPAGNWTLSIDGTSVGTYTSEEIASGIDLGMNEKTPQHAQACRVADFEEQRWIEERRIRAVEWVRARVTAPQGIDWNDRAAVLEAVKAWPTNSGYTESHQRYLDAYVADRVQEDSIAADVERLAKHRNEAARPVERTWLLAPAE